jgi:hypothetical protein
MELDSYLEIFTTMYGWAFANIIGEVLTGTGLVALPFGLIVFSVWRGAKESASGGAGAQELIDAVMTRILIALFVYITCFAVTPYTSLVSTNLRYTPQASLTNPTPTGGSLNLGTGSSYDTALQDARDGTMSPTGGLSYVPAWWFSVMAVSSGINNAVRSGLSSARSDIRMVEDMARTATIEDPQLLHQIQRFYSECFVPARSRFLQMDRSTISGNGAAVIAETNTDYGPTDVDWMGSQLFRTEPGFYGTMRSYDPVPGFPVDLNRDTDYTAGGAPGTPEATDLNPTWGRPTCLQWWLDGASGVRSRMISHASTWQTLLQGMQSAMNWSSADRATDALAMLAQSRANPQFMDASRIMGNDYDGITNLVRGIGGAVSTFGVGKKLIDATIEFMPMVTALPMIQSMLLMGMYMFLPMIVMLSGYDLKIMLLGGLAIFTVKFWSVMWFIAQWVDARLIQAMYPGLNGNIVMQEFIAMGTNAGDGSLYKRMILNLVLMSMFVGLPLLWSAMMGWVGMNMGSGIMDLMRQTKLGMADAAKNSKLRRRP